MFSLLTFLIGVIFNLLRSKKNLLIQVCLYKKELEILKRQYQRFYVSFILYHKTREIVQYAITTNPTREFGRQQLIEFEQNIDHVVYMIHDHASQFNINYIEYGIKNIKTSVKAPNMNAFAERFVGSVRREALHYYLLINEKQIECILDKYINYYNSKRPHQGINQKVPRRYKPQLYGKVQKLPILGGLHHQYIRRAA